MRQEIINSPSGSGLGDKLNIAFQKVNEMTEEIYTAIGSMSGSLTVTKTSDLTNDGADGVNPFISASQVPTTWSINSITGLTSSLNDITSSINVLSSSLSSSQNDIINLQNDVNLVNNSITSINQTVASQSLEITAINQILANFDDNLDGWVEITNSTTGSLTSGSANLISFSGSADSNGGLNLLINGDTIKPVGLNDFITIDFTLGVLTPSGSNNFITIEMRNNSDVFRANTYQLIKNAGVSDIISVSYGFPAKAAVVADGIKIYVTPNKAITYNKKYLNVLSIYKGQ